MSRKYNGKNVMKCAECGNEFKCFSYEVEKNRKFCSQACYYEWQKDKPKPKPKNFRETMRKVNPPRGIKIHKNDKGGYVLLFRPEHPNARQCPPNYGYVFEHVYNLSNHIGRMIERGEVIHHLDGDKRNNDVSNLVLCENHSEHTKIHHSMNNLVYEMIKSGEVEYARETKSFRFTKRFRT